CHDPRAAVAGFRTFLRGVTLLPISRCAAQRTARLRDELRARKPPMNHRASGRAARMGDPHAPALTPHLDPAYPTATRSPSSLRAHTCHTSRTSHTPRVATSPSNRPRRPFG